MPSTLTIPAPIVSELDWGGTVYDLGCGAGSMGVEALCNGTARFVGIDVNREALVVSAKSVSRPGASFVVGDITALPSSDASGDGAILKAVLTGIPDHDERTRVLAETRRVLRDGAWLVLVDVQVSDGDGYRRRYARGERLGLPSFTFPVEDASGRLLYYAHHFSPHELRSIVEAAGFRVEAANMSSAHSRTGNPLRQLTLLGRKRRL